MKKLILIIIVLFSVYALPQVSVTRENNIVMTRGDSVVCTLKVIGDKTDHALSFAVKEGTDFADDRLIQKDTTTGIELSYLSPYTSIVVTIRPEDTQDLTAKTYYYDVYDSTAKQTIINAYLTIKSDVQTPFDGTNLPSGGVRITTVSLANGTLQGETIAWDTTNNVWQPSGNVFNSSQLASVDSVADLLRSELLANSDSTQFRAFSDLKYLNNSDSTLFRTFSNLKYLANGDTVGFRTFSDAKYFAKADTNVFVSDAYLNARLNALPVGTDSTVVQNLIESRVDTAFTRIDTTLANKVDADSIQSWEETSLLIGDLIADSLAYERSKRGFINIKDFAPKGTATDGTVDWTQYYNLAKASFTNGGSKIYFPAGSYRLNINWKDNNNEIFGDISNNNYQGLATRFYSAIHNDTIIKITSQQNIIRNIEFIGYISSGLYADVGVWQNYNYNLIIKDCVFRDFHGGSNSIATHSKGFSCVFQDLKFQDNDTHLFIDSTQLVTVERCLFGNAKVACIRGYRSTDIMFTNCDITNSNGYPSTCLKYIQLDRPARWVFRDIYSEGILHPDYRFIYAWDTSGVREDRNIFIEGGLFGNSTSDTPIEIIGYPFRITLVNAQLIADDYPVIIQDSLDINGYRLNNVDFISCKLSDTNGAWIPSTIFHYTQNMWDEILTLNVRYRYSTIINNNIYLPEYGSFTQGIVTTGLGGYNSGDHLQGRKNLYGYRIPTYQSIQSNDTILVTVDFSYAQPNSTAFITTFMDATIKFRWGSSSNQAGVGYKIHIYQSDNGTSSSNREFEVVDTMGVGALLGTNLPSKIEFYNATSDSYSFIFVAPSTLSGTYELAGEVVEGTNIKSINITEF